jgi:hypothetical protein
VNNRAIFKTREDARRFIKKSKTFHDAWYSAHKHKLTDEFGKWDPPKIRKVSLSMSFRD